MKQREKQQAILMRSQGESITHIARKLGVSKASVSGWVRDVVLSDKTLRQIRARSHAASAVEARRRARLHNEAKKRSAAIADARKDVGKISKRELFLIGIALYWGEGSKRKPGVVEFTNSDPAMIRVMRRFLTECCDVPVCKLRGHVYLHEHLNIETAERYWSTVANLPCSQFHKTSIQHNRNRIKRDTLPHGTFALLVCDTQLRLKLQGWMEGMQQRALQ